MVGGQTIRKEHMRYYKKRSYSVTLKNEDWEMIEYFAEIDKCSVHQEMSNIIGMGLEQLKLMYEELKGTGEENGNVN